MLKEEIKKTGIDKIPDDEKFMLAENDFIREYCIKRKFNLPLADLREICRRGLTDTYEDWKFMYENGELIEEDGE